MSINMQESWGAEQQIKCYPYLLCILYYPQIQHKVAISRAYVCLLKAKAHSNTWKYNLP